MDLRAFLDQRYSFNPVDVIHRIVSKSSMQWRNSKIMQQKKKEKKEKRKKKKKWYREQTSWNSWNSESVPDEGASCFVARVSSRK